MSIMNMLILKHIKQESGISFVDIVLDSETNGIKSLYLNEKITKQFKSIANQINSFRIETEYGDLIVLDIMKSLRSKSWSLMTSHSFTHFAIQKVIESDFYFEKFASNFAPAIANGVQANHSTATTVVQLNTTTETLGASPMMINPLAASAHNTPNPGLRSSLKPQSQQQKDHPETPLDDRFRSPTAEVKPLNLKSNDSPVPVNLNGGSARNSLTSTGSFHLISNPPVSTTTIQPAPAVAPVVAPVVSAPSVPVIAPATNTASNPTNIPATSNPQLEKPQTSPEVMALILDKTTQQKGPYGFASRQSIIGKLKRSYIYAQINNRSLAFILFF